MRQVGAHGDGEQHWLGAGVDRVGKPHEFRFRACRLTDLHEHQSGPGDRMAG